MSRRLRQGPPACYFIILKINFGADVTARVVITIQVALQKSGAIAGNFTVGPKPRFFHDGPVIEPNSDVTALSFVLQDLCRRAPGDINRVRTHADLDLALVHQLSLLG